MDTSKQGSGESFTYANPTLDREAAELNIAKGFIGTLTPEQRKVLEELAEKGIPIAFLTCAYNAIVNELKTPLECRTPGILISTQEHTRHLLSGGDRRE